MARSFTNGFIQLGIGAFQDFTGDFTIAMILKKDEDNSNARVAFMAGSLEATATYYPYFDNGTAGDVGIFNGAVIAIEQTDFLLVSDNWVALLFDRDGATNEVRVHKYSYDDEAWTHAAMGTLPDSTTLDFDAGIGGCIGCFNLGGFYHDSFWPGAIEIVGMVHEKFADDAAVESADLENNYLAWVEFFSGDSAGLWPLNQASTAIAVEDVTGNGADQLNSESNTVVDGPVQFGYFGPPIDQAHPFTAIACDRFGTALGNALVEIQNYVDEQQADVWLDYEHTEYVTDHATLLTNDDGLLTVWLAAGLYRWRTTVGAVSSSWEPVEV